MIGIGIPMIAIGGPLYTFSTLTFTNATATGRYGPTLANCQTAYGAQTWTQNTAFLSVTGGIQIWTVPENGNYQILAAGGQGGSCTVSGEAGGTGAKVRGSFALLKGQQIKILVGQAGGSYGYASGGGGATFVVNNVASPVPTDILLAAGAGGGGGNSGGAGFQAVTTTAGRNSSHGGLTPAGTNGYGSTNASNGGYGQSGAGFRGNGNGQDTNGSWGAGTVGQAYINGGVGAQENGTSPTASCNGGFGGFGGGGSGACNGGGGGAGYSGGCGGSGAGGSYISSVATSVATSNALYEGVGTFGGVSIVNLASWNSGMGFVTITKL